MDVKQAITRNLELSDFFLNAYLSDLKDSELLIRPCNGGNHIAWQLGHLISTEASALGKLSPGKTAELPAGFADRYGRGTCASDDPKGYATKEEYLRLAKQVRAGTLKALEGLTPADLDEPVTGVPPMIKTKGELLLLLAMHWMMHEGQWVIVRRNTGRPPMF